jgi:hypothetical protein
VVESFSAAVEGNFSTSLYHGRGSVFRHFLPW